MKNIKFDKKIQILIILSTVFFLIPFLIYFYVFHDGISFDDSNWANFGGFIGGIGATIFSFASFIALLFNIHSEKEKNEKTLIDEEIKKEEERFFRYLDYLLACRERLYCIINNQETITGPSVINFYNFQIEFLYSRRNILRKEYKDNLIEYQKKEEKTDGYIFLYEAANEAIMSFSNLCTQITTYVNNTKHLDKEVYLNLFISQLSNQDKMLLVFNNGQTIQLLREKEINILPSKSMLLFTEIRSDAYSFIELIK